MVKILHVDSSIRGADSASRSLSAEIVAAELRRNPAVSVIYRDLAANPIGHLSGAHLSVASGAAPVSADLQDEVATSVAALEEFLAADIIVIGAPMYNFGVPSQLKAWIDRLVIAGRTFHYTENGPEGLVGGKRVVVASSRGGFYGPDSGLNFLDHQQNYLMSVFGFIGITDVTIISAEGLNIGVDERNASMKAARDEIRGIAA